MTVTWASDGAAIEAVISGGAAGDSHRLMASRWSEVRSLSLSFSLRASRVGNGSIVATVDPGQYFCYVATTHADGTQDMSALRIMAVRPVEWSDGYATLVAVQEAIQAIGLPVGDGELPAEKVLIQKLPWAELLTNLQAPHGIRPPLVIVSPLRESRQPKENLGDEVTRRVQVALIRTASNRAIGAADGMLPSELRWRDILSAAFTSAGFSLTPRVHTVQVEYGPPVLPEAFAANYDVGTMVVVATAAVSRGIT